VLYTLSGRLRRADLRCEECDCISVVLVGDISVVHVAVVSVLPMTLAMAFRFRSGPGFGVPFSFGDTTPIAVQLKESTFVSMRGAEIGVAAGRRRAMQDGVALAFWW